MDVRRRTRAIAEAAGVLLLGLVALAFVLRFTGHQSGQSPQEAQPTGTVPTLIWYVEDERFFSQWGSDIVSKLIQEACGVSVQFMTPRSLDPAHLSALMVTASAPDLITLARGSLQIPRLINGGAIADMAQAGLDLAGAQAGYAAVIRASAWDDAIYLCPGVYSLEDTPSMTLQNLPALLVREDIYRALGAPDMTTPEGFLSALAAAQAWEGVCPLGLEEMTGVGCGSIDTVLMQCLNIPHYVDGLAYDRQMDADLLRWLRMLADAWRQGVLPRSTYLDTTAQIEQKLQSGQYFAFLGNVAVFEEALQKAGAGYRYIPVAPPANGAGDGAAFVDDVDALGRYATMVNATGKTGDAMRLINYMISPQGQQDLYLGQENIMWRATEAGAGFIGRGIALRNESVSDYQAIYGGLFHYYMLSSMDAIGDWPAVESDALAPVWQSVQPALVSRSREHAVEIELARRIPGQVELMEQAWGRALPGLLTAQTEAAFEAGLAAYRQERDDLGFDALQQARTALWQEGGAP